MEPLECGLLKILFIHYAQLSKTHGNIKHLTPSDLFLITTYYWTEQFIKQ